MNWDDLKDSSEYAEVIGLLASLIAAVLALKKAEKDDCSEEKDAEETSDTKPKIDGELKFIDASSVLNPLALQKSGMKPKMNLVFAGLCFVAVIQLAIILFIAYRLA